MQVNAKNTYGITPLHLACQVGNLQGVKLLIDHEKITLDAKDYNGDTPLHEACYHGNEEIAEALLDKMKQCDKLDLAIKNELELTPLERAIAPAQTEERVNAPTLTVREKKHLQRRKIISPHFILLLSMVA